MPELTDDNSLKRKILEESQGYFASPPREDEFTIRDFIEAHDEKISEDEARSALKRMVKDNKIYCRQGTLRKSKTRCNVYGWIKE